MRKSKDGLDIKIKQMNDLCPLIFKCREPYCWNKFGKYETCNRYKADNPRISNPSILYT